VTGANDRVAECASCGGAGNERFSDETKLRGVVVVVARLVRLESGGEFVGLVEDFSGGSGCVRPPSLDRTTKVHPTFRFLPLTAWRRTRLHRFMLTE
jgi:hypothetical protein